jgi:hypothetical protein
MLTANVTLTYSDLVRWKACKSQLRQARATFGDSVTLTRAVLLRAAHAGLDVHWLAPRLLLRELLLDFPLDRAPALVQADFDRAMASALAAFDRTTTSARADFDRAMASARAAFYREVDLAKPPPRADFDRAVDLAMAEFNRAIASARADLSVVAATVLADQLHLPDA